MRELYIEGVAIHGRPESCVGVREGVGEALTGVAQAGLWSREKSVRGADAVQLGGRRHRYSRYRERVADPARSENPGMRGILHAREPGGPMVARQRSMMPRPGRFAGWHIGGWVGREGKAVGRSLR
jgi:hypothetical protein